MRKFLLLITMTALIFSCKKRENCYLFTIERSYSNWSPQVGGTVTKTDYILVEKCDITKKEAETYNEFRTYTETQVNGNLSTTFTYKSTYKIKE